MVQSNQLDFSGQNIYCGIDVHKKSWKVCIRSEHMELKTFSQNPSAEDLVKHLRKNYPSANYKAVYEAGFSGFSHQRQMEKDGVQCIVVHAADVPVMDKEKLRKSDTVDCRKLSKTLGEGALTGIFVPKIEQQDDRGVIRAYNQMVKDQTRFKNRIRSFLDFQGIAAVKFDGSTYWSNNFLTWLKEVPLTPTARISLDLLIQGYENARKMVLIATRQVRALSRQDRHKDQIKLLRSIPGIGQISALLFATEIGDINRFKEFDQLCDFIGLVPKTHSSGESDHILGLTHRGHKELREVLIEASWIAVRLDPAMTMAFNNLAKRMIKNKAIIKIAKKMLNRIRFVMKNKKEYVSGTVS